MTSSAARRLAITSYMLGAQYLDPHWPASGPTDWGATLASLPDPSLVTVQDLPVRNPGHLHFQKGAQWVVLEIDLADHESVDGIVRFKRGVVLFNGPAPEACEYLRSLGLPAPSSYGEVADVRDWGKRAMGDNSIVLGGFEAEVTSGNHSLAFAQSGKVGCGDDSFAVSAYGSVAAGDRGIAVSRYGTSAHAGDFGLARVDEFGEAVAGRAAVAIAATGGRARCGEAGVAVGVHGGNATAGEDAVALAYDRSGIGGCAVAAKQGLAIAGGERSSVQAGEAGILIMTWYDGTRMRASVAYVGEDGIAPDTPYTVDERGQFVPAPGPVRP